MDQSERIDEALRLDRLELPPKPKVKRLLWEPYEDWYGEESLKVWVILDDATTDDDIMKAPGHSTVKKGEEVLAIAELLMEAGFFKMAFDILEELSWYTEEASEGTRKAWREEHSTQKTDDFWTRVALALARAWSKFNSE